MNKITISIDGQAVSVPLGTTILQAAHAAGINIPTVCYHEATTANAVCRTCVVEIDGARVLAAACVAKVSEGMKVRTRSERVERSRRTILEMLASTVDLSDSPEILAMLAEYKSDPRALSRRRAARSASDRR